jgi:hypothetical protein
MNQTELIKGLVKVLREDIRKTLKEEIRKAVTEVLNEELQTPSKPSVNENYQAVSKDDGNWGEMRFNRNNVNPSNPVKPIITPDMFGYDANAFGEQANMQDTYSQAGPSVEQQARMLQHKNPEGVELVMKAMNRDYSQLVKKFKK